jgi:spore maturation protein CgeB
VKSAVHVVPESVFTFAGIRTLVTEYCLGMENYFPPETYICADYNELPERIEALLADPAKLEQMGEAAYSWISNTHLRNCELEWKKRIDEIHAHFYTRTVNHGSAVSKGTTADPGSCQMDHTDSTIMQG